MSAVPGSACQPSESLLMTAATRYRASGTVSITSTPSQGKSRARNGESTARRQGGAKHAAASELATTSGGPNGSRLAEKRCAYNSFRRASASTWMGSGLAGRRRHTLSHKLEGANSHRRTLQGQSERARHRNSRAQSREIARAYRDCQQVEAHAKPTPLQSAATQQRQQALGVTARKGSNDARTA